MKKGNAVKVVLIISIIVLILLISFVGIYVKKTNKYENIIPNYNLGMDLGQKRVITLKVNSGKKTIIYDTDGKEVSSIPEGEDESNYKKEEVIINPEEKLTEENYKKAKNIIEERLKKVKVDGYSIKYSKTSGDIILELPNNDRTDDVVNTLTPTGKFEMVSEATGKELLSNSDLKKATIAYANGQTQSGSQATSVYVIVQLNKEGTKKLKEITNTYVETNDEENNTTTNNTTTNNTTANNTTTNNTTNNTTKNNTTKNNTTKNNTTKNNTTTNNTTNNDTTKESGKVILRLDWPNSYTGNIEYTDVTTQAFDSQIKDGKLQLNIGTATTNEKLQEYYNQAMQVSSILNSGLNEIEYEIDRNEIIGTEITQMQINITICVLSVLFAIMSIVMIIVLREYGIIGTIVNIAMVACSLIFVRLTKVVVGVSAIPAIVSIVVVNTLIILKLIKSIKYSENKKTAIWHAILESIDILIVLLVIAVTCTFTVNEMIASAGMIMFWGIISIILTILLFARPLLLAVNKK